MFTWLLLLLVLLQHSHTTQLLLVQRSNPEQVLISPEAVRPSLTADWLSTRCCIQKAIFLYSLPYTFGCFTWCTGFREHVFLGNTFCLVNHCCQRCHGACFQRCRTDTPVIHPGIKHCTTSTERRSGKNLLGHQVHLPVVTSNHITRSIRKRLIGLSQLMGSLVWQRNKGSKVWKLHLGDVRLATRGYPI